LPNEGSAQINQDSIKTSAGALLRLPICKVNNIKTALNFLHQVGVKVFSATEKTNNIYTNSSYKEPLLLILGAEDKGISKDCLKLSDEMIKIPLKGEIESLNVSVSAGIIIYEILRQRELK
jgi:23S rRNA (guanosine2251-2'-O)-methyltransferase